METNIVTALVLPGALFIIMLGLGLSLRVSDFARVVRLPRAAALGLSLQLIALPAVGFLLAVGFGLPPELAVGLMILAACPGGATSNLITYLARGDAALSVTLTAISSFVSVLTIPLIINLSMLHFMGEGEVIPPPILQTIGQIVIVTLIPVSIGMAIHARAPKFAQRAGRPVKIFSALFLALIIVGLVLNQRAEIMGFFLSSGPATLALNIVMLTLGYGTALLAGLRVQERIAISIEGGMQNGTLAIAIAAGILQSPVMAIPAAIYSLVMFGTAFVAIVLFSRLDRSPA